jgi:hypothetical protein
MRTREGDGRGGVSAMRGGRRGDARRCLWRSFVEEFDGNDSGKYEPRGRCFSTYRAEEPKTFPQISWIPPRSEGTFSRDRTGLRAASTAQLYSPDLIIAEPDLSLRLQNGSANSSQGSCYKLPSAQCRHRSCSTLACESQQSSCSPVSSARILPGRSNKCLNLTCRTLLGRCSLQVSPHLAPRDFTSCDASCPWFI